MGVLLAGASNSAPASLDSLREGATRDDVMRLAGTSPQRCVYSGPDRELCRWEIEGQLVTPGSQAGAGRVVALVCDLPTQASDTPSGQCFARPAASSDGALPAVSSAGENTERARRAAAALAEARTVVDLSRLVGDAPDACHTRWGGQVCSWSLDAGDAGAQDLASLTQGVGAKQLRCLLPLDSAQRKPESCVVVEVE